MEQQQQPLPALPEAVLVGILQLVPLRERLSSCMPVCHAWAAAAALTSAHLEAELSSCTRWEHRQEWMQQHAGRVTSIDFSHSGPTRQRLLLPCRELNRLQRLSVHSMTIQLQDSPTTPSTGAVADQADLSSSFSSRCTLASSDAVPPFLPLLQQLTAFDCSLALPDFMQLSRATALTRLSLDHVAVTLPGDDANAADDSAQASTRDTACAASTEEQQTAALSALLQALPALRHLEVRMNEVSALALCPVSGMQHLQRLEVDIAPDDEHTDALLASFPPSLTALELRTLNLTPSTAVAQELQRLASLQQLVLEEADLAPLLLQQWTGLTKLALDAVYLKAPPKASAAAGLDKSNRAAQALLSGLGQLRQLQCLSLSRMQLDEVSSVTQLSALTASPNLTSLEVLARFLMPLPRNSLRRVLPEGRVLRQLRALRLQGGDGTQEGQCLDGADVRSIAECCPALSELSLRGVVSVGASLSPLLALRTCLRSLRLSGRACDDAAAAVVAQLQGLRVLHWQDSARLTVGGLRQLTVLTGLTELYVRSCVKLVGTVLPAHTWYAEPSILLQDGTEGKDHDVWRQLQQRFDSGTG